MAKKKVKDDFTSFNISADQTQDSWILLTTWPRVPAANDLHQSYLGSVFAPSMLFNLEQRPIVWTLVRKLAMFRRPATAIVTAKTCDCCTSRQDVGALAVEPESPATSFITSRSSVPSTIMIEMGNFGFLSFRADESCAVRGATAANLSDKSIARRMDMKPPFDLPVV
jgi:hypothetical protein